MSGNEIKEFFRSSKFSPIKKNDPELWRKLSVKENILHSDASIDSYLAADIAEFIRQQLLAAGTSFTYETVMSHDGKVDFLREALHKGYRV